MCRNTKFLKKSVLFHDLVYLCASSLTMFWELKNITLAIVYALQVELTGIFMLCRVNVVVHSDFRVGYKHKIVTVGLVKIMRKLFFLSFFLSFLSFFFTSFSPFSPIIGSCLSQSTY